MEEVCRKHGIWSMSASNTRIFTTSFTTAIPQIRQQLTTKPLTPTSYPKIMRKIDKRSLTYCQNAQNSTGLPIDLSAEARAKAEAVAKVDEKRKYGETKLLFQQPPFNPSHSSTNPTHPDSLLHLTASTGSSNRCEL